MSKLFILSLLYFQCSSFAQSPSLSVRLQMIFSDSANYKIEMKICKPVKGSLVNDYFNNETSTINFKSLNIDEISCGDYILSYDNTKHENIYYYSNQVFAWEKVLIWRITNDDAASKRKSMYIILPVKMKSFVTNIQLSDIKFQAGKFIWINETGVIDENKHQLLKLSLKNNEAVAIGESNFKNIIN